MARPDRHVYYDGTIDDMWFVPRLNDWVENPDGEYSCTNNMHFKTLKKAVSAMTRWPKMRVDKTVLSGGKRYFVGGWKPIE